MPRPDARNHRTQESIKDALLKLLEAKPLREISVTEVARAAHVSRSTFYAHFNNLEEVRESVFRDFAGSFPSLHDQMRLAAQCADCSSRRPLCWALRDAGKYAPLVNDPLFGLHLATAVETQESDLFDRVLGQTYSREVIMALRRFQLHGCYAAATCYSPDQDWTEAQQAIDLFIRGGLAALRNQRK